MSSWYIHLTRGEKTCGKRESTDLDEAVRAFFLLCEILLARWVGVGWGGGGVGVGWGGVRGGGFFSR